MAKVGPLLQRVDYGLARMAPQQSGDEASLAMSADGGPQQIEPAGVRPWLQAVRTRVQLPAPRAWAPPLLLLGAAILSLWPVLVDERWPRNHESWVWAVRVGVLYDAWQRGEWLPLWWSQGNHGLGSPMPALYHKLFNYVCALLLLVVGQAKLALSMSLVLFSFIGSLGVSRLARRLGAAPALATVYALMLPFSNYAVADWLIRGAFAEYAAFMLLPWLLVALLDTLRTGELRVLPITGLMVLTFYAHSVMALYCGGLALLVAALTLLLHPGRRWRFLWRGALAGMLFLAAVAPTLWLLRVLSRSFDLDYTLRHNYRVEKHLTTLSNAVLHGEAEYVGFSVAPDPELLALVALAALLVLVPRLRARADNAWREPALAFLLLALAASIFLRTHGAAWLYEHVPGLRYIQFPWRLLSMTTVLLLGLAAFFTARLRWQVGGALALLTLLALGLHSRVFHFHEDVWIAPEELEASLNPAKQVRWWEYMPNVAGAHRPDRQQSWASRVRALSPACEISEPETDRFVASCSEPGTVALPYAFSGLERVTDGAGVAREIHRARGDARIRVELPVGRTELRYHKPSWRTALSHAFSR